VRAIEQAKGRRDNDREPEAEADFCEIRLFRLAEYAPMLHDLQVQLCDRCESDVLGHTGREGDVYVGDHPNDLNRKQSSSDRNSGQKK
jgi:hypothetical protein